MPEPVPALWREPAMAARITLIGESFARLLGRPLTGASADPVAALWRAGAVIVAHDTEPDPRFFFGNRAALAAFETDVDAFIGMPSRLSAEPALRAVRAAFMERVTREGFVDDYAGVRISRNGRRFAIERGVVWNLVDADGIMHGQAATFAAPLQMPAQPDQQHRAQDRG